MTASNFTTGTIEQFLEDVVQRADTNPVKRMRLAALPPPAMTARPPAVAFRAAETLPEDTVLLAEARTGTDLSAFRQALAQRRQPLARRPPG